MIRIVNVRGLRTEEQREGIVYVGRAFGGWSGDKLGNPFRPVKDDSGNVTPEAVYACMERYREWLLKRSTLEQDPRELWEHTKQGTRPLGCWCVESVSGSGDPIVCHAQILAQELHKRFLKPAAKRKGK
jgi:hypothetical protein